MKKYIAPIARDLRIEMESIIAMSNINGEGNGQDLSNKRNPSESIWGE